jgi:hypothetical protein
MKYFRGPILFHIFNEPFPQKKESTLLIYEGSYAATELPVVLYFITFSEHWSLQNMAIPT